jgi:hypothetical protein
MDSLGEDRVLFDLPAPLKINGLAMAESPVGIGATKPGTNCASRQGKNTAARRPAAWPAWALDARRLQTRQDQQ